jgi:hypothetical protein
MSEHVVRPVILGLRLEEIHVGDALNGTGEALDTGHGSLLVREVTITGDSAVASRSQTDFCVGPSRRIGKIYKLTQLAAG